MDNTDGNGRGRHDLSSPPSTLLREEIMRVGGKEMINWTEAYVSQDDGGIKRQTKVNYNIAADGRWLKQEEFTATSYTNEPIPHDRVFSCLNPFDNHSYRLVYFDIDGFMTQLGNVLCTECFALNKRKQKLRKWFLWGWLYNPEEF